MPLSSRAPHLAVALATLVLLAGAAAGACTGLWGRHASLELNPCNFMHEVYTSCMKLHGLSSKLAWRPHSPVHAPAAAPASSTRVARATARCGALELSGISCSWPSMQSALSVEVGAPCNNQVVAPCRNPASVAPAASCLATEPGLLCQSGLLVKFPRMHGIHFHAQ